MGLISFLKGDNLSKQDKYFKKLFNKQDLELQVLGNESYASVLDWPNKDIQTLTNKYESFVKSLKEHPSVNDAGYTFLAGGSYCIYVLKK